MRESMGTVPVSTMTISTGLSVWVWTLATALVNSYGRSHVSNTTETLSVIGLRRGMGFRSHFLRVSRTAARAMMTITTITMAMYNIVLSSLAYTVLSPMSMV